MLYAIITSYTVGLLYLVSLTVTIQVICVSSRSHDSTHHQLPCILHLALCQFWFQVEGLAFGMRTTPKVHGMQNDPLSLFVKLRFVHNHFMYA